MKKAVGACLPHIEQGGYPSAKRTRPKWLHQGRVAPQIWTRRKIISPDGWKENGHHSLDDVSAWDRPPPATIAATPRVPVHGRHMERVIFVFSPAISESDIATLLITSMLQTPQKAAATGSSVDFARGEKKDSRSEPCA